MTSSLGILFAIGALLSWTIGDFFIQKGTRLVGNMKTLFFIGFLGLAGIFPFVKDEIPLLFQNPKGLFLLSMLSIITFVTALFLFEGFKRGKIAVIAPVISLELLFTVAFSVLLNGEILPLHLYFFIGLVLLGLLLTVTTHAQHFHKTALEKGVILTGVGTVGLGLINTLTGMGAQQLSPLLTIWFTHSALALFCGTYFFFTGELSSLLHGITKNLKTVATFSIFDNLAWISYAYSMSLIPISIATTFSESYVVLVVLLGVFVNREKLQWHQIAGIILVLAGTIPLSLYAT